MLSFPADIKINSLGPDTLGRDTRATTPKLHSCPNKFIGQIFVDFICKLRLMCPQNVTSGCTQTQKICSLLSQHFLYHTLHP